MTVDVGPATTDRAAGGDKGNGVIRNNQPRQRLQPWITARRGGDSGVGRGETKTIAEKPSIEATAKAMDDG